MPPVYAPNIPNNNLPEKPASGDYDYGDVLKEAFSTTPDSEEEKEKQEIFEKADKLLSAKDGTGSTNHALDAEKHPTKLKNYATHVTTSHPTTGDGLKLQTEMTPEISDSPSQDAKSQTLPDEDKVSWKKFEFHTTTTTEPSTTIMSSEFACRIHIRRSLRKI